MTNNYQSDTNDFEGDFTVDEGTELAMVLEGLVSIYQKKIELGSKHGFDPRLFDQVIKLARQIAYVKQVMNTEKKGYTTQEKNLRN